jgi:diadenosine tetraphosphate (Ap4A) HIT family hydrolase
VNSSAATFELHPQLAADTRFVAALDLCDVLLMNDANYPWLILVPRVPGMRDVVDLDESQQLQLMREIAQASRALRSLFQPHKLNVAALGNMVAQLHVHVIARQTDDAAWPTPVWGRVPARAYEEAEIAARIRDLQDALRG